MNQKGVINLKQMKIKKMKEFANNQKKAVQQQQGRVSEIKKVKPTMQK